MEHGSIYLYEMHLHTCPCSGGGGDLCAHIDDLMQKGYSGAVVTNHFCRGDSRIDRSLPWEAFVDAYKKDYLYGLAYAKKVGFDLLFGLEQSVGQGREILIYGLDPDFFIAHPELNTSSAETYAEVVHEGGGLVYQAHPYRARSYISLPEPLDCLQKLDGIEVYNAGNEPDWNEKAQILAQKLNLACVAGSDGHAVGTAGRAGIAVKERIKSNKDLVRVLKNKAYTLVCNH